MHIIVTSVPLFEILGVIKCLINLAWIIYKTNNVLDKMIKLNLTNVPKLVLILISELNLIPKLFK